ncbi:hypothetical protein I302_105274 [Kwoniella bestiolae CBS 10118]|uniref:Myo-inositol 2-dehydrogenase n=1 Tax=Kwoniella bestiolae CBS 10118 TaxID=1296100 RepID=A0A1B9FSP1_9TREE|nr:myo-inositol 2-dehydrogenase [Kwoniella bestiolae CBS 10118]OCF21783.1 myo-inositol 2-dehydrogenase [Kwoniella bestiolae CBS 10118]
MTTPRKLRYAVLGLGRMGQRHALNVAFKTPRAELISVVDPRPISSEWASTSLPPSTKVFQDLKSCLEGSDVDAVLISTETATHAPLTIQALNAGKHVLLEKPISIDVETSRQVVHEAEKFPELKVMVGFSRRFDESYREVKRMIEEGILGQTHLVKSATNDQYDPSGFFVKFATSSGGIFVDCAIHDIDLARWFLLPQSASTTDGMVNKKQVRKVYALGHNVRHPELSRLDDVDNGIGIVEFENDTILVVHANRTMSHGHDCFTEVFGTESKVIVNGNPTLNRIEIRDSHGVRTESTPTYYERFKDAFVTEVNEFTDAVLEGKPVPITLLDSLEAVKVASALQHSYKTGQPVFFGDDGEAILT